MISRCCRVAAGRRSAWCRAYMSTGSSSISSGMPGRRRSSSARTCRGTVPITPPARCCSPTSPIPTGTTSCIETQRASWEWTNEKLDQRFADEFVGGLLHRGAVPAVRVGLHAGEHLAVAQAARSRLHLHLRERSQRLHYVAQFVEDGSRATRA